MFWFCVVVVSVAAGSPDPNRSLNSLVGGAPTTFCRLGTTRAEASDRGFAAA
jgi:hypothetical protein